MPLSASLRLPDTEMSRNTPQEDRKVAFSPELSARTPSLPLRTPNLPLTFIRPYNEDTSMLTANRAIAFSDSNSIQHPYLTPSPEAMQWSAQGSSAPRILPEGDSLCGVPNYFTADTSCAEYRHHPRNGLPYNLNHFLGYPTDCTATHLSGFGNSDLVALPEDMTLSYPPSAFFHSPDNSCTNPLPDASMSHLMQSSDDYSTHYAGIKYEDQLDYASHSPYSRMSRASTPYSTAFEDDEPIDKEQPYAQLIYRALLNAPQYTMVLRDIYEWFRIHTDKATHSETKGWQNSIRHNLSMNGAFEKVDSPADASTKGFMWRLTEDALREGVKSTTRYRSKAPNKRALHRAHPLPQRQASGAKGGHAARRAANQRRSQRVRDSYQASNHNTPRSEPYSTSRHSDEWDGDRAYAPSSACPSRIDSPYSQPSFSPYHVPKDNAPFTPMMSLASPFMSPVHTHANMPVTSATPFMAGDDGFGLGRVPVEPLFSGSPTPPVDEPITPVNASTHGAWAQDFHLDVGMYEELAHFGGST
ncbi:fork head domain-containing protein [Stagonosporopsis vannaccii]|nr:fork head domain-containing protein [Stagonosporopsis vannaccii]